MKLHHSDEELLSMYARTGRGEYFGQLYDRYIPLLYGLCLKYLHRPEAAEDAVMGLYETLAPKIKNYPIKVFRTWLYSVAKNHCLQILRKEKPIVKVEIQDNLMESDPVLHLFDEDPRHRALEECMEKLPEPQRVAVQLFFVEELSYVQVAERAGYSLQSVKSYIQNGKRNLRICIEKREAQHA